MFSLTIIPEGAMNQTENPSVKVEFKYEGADVDNGTMQLDDIVPALQGFSTAYKHTLNFYGIDKHHELRLTSIKRGSFELVINVIEFITNHGEVFTTIIPLGGVTGIYNIIRMILAQIGLIKHVKKEKYTYDIHDNKTVNVFNSDNISLNVPLDVFDLYRKHFLDKSLERIVAPLKEGEIDIAKITTIGVDKESLRGEISYTEKPYFEVEETEITKTKEVWLPGKLISHHKKTNNGKFSLINGTVIPYHFAMENPESYYQYYIHKGAVKVNCIAHFDEELNPTRIEIFDMEKIQGDLLDKS